MLNILWMLSRGKKFFVNVQKSLCNIPKKFLKFLKFRIIT